jgi:hypothetical protein
VKRRRSDHLGERLKGIEASREEIGDAATLELRDCRLPRRIDAIATDQLL